MPDIKLLDCTLRDGGYVNSWNWGFAAAKDIIASLTRAGTDIVEVGFLRNVDGYNPDVTVCNTIEELNRLLPAHTGSTMYSGMAMRSNYDIAKLSPYEGHGIEMLRITAHDYDIREGMDFAREVKARGYKLSINPINIMGYADKDLLWILDQVNEIHPYQFSIVDTFGSMRRRDLERIVSLVDHNLAPDIRVGLHLHENMALSFCLAQEFLDKHLGRDTYAHLALFQQRKNNQQQDGRTQNHKKLEMCRHGRCASLFAFRLVDFLDRKAVNDQRQGNLDHVIRAFKTANAGNAALTFFHDDRGFAYAEPGQRGSQNGFRLRIIRSIMLRKIGG